MDIARIPPGKNPPQEINVLIEIPQTGLPIKFELDKKSGALFVDRFMYTPMHYPCNYGFVPNTLAEDGDPVDALVLAPHPVPPGTVIPSRPIGMLEMEDESGVDAKILAVPLAKISPLYETVQTFSDLPPLVIDQIQHFFEHYKDLEPGKWVKVRDWHGPEAAHKEIMDAIARAQGKKG